MQTSVIYGLLIPFVGTSLGSACVFFLKKGLGDRVQRGLTGFASGVMVAASIWSLLIPAIDRKSTRLNSSPRFHLVCRLLLEK